MRRADRFWKNRSTLNHLKLCGVIGARIIGSFASLQSILALTASTVNFQQLWQGVLTGGAVAICGASAALAIAAALPKHENSERDTLLTVISVTVMSTVAMVLYPLLVRAIGFDDRTAGILLGGTIHDVAQVVGAGQLFSDSAAVIATYVKLLRVAMLLPAVLVISALFAVRIGAPSIVRQPLLPMFLVGFVALAIANSIGAVPSQIADTMAVASRWCLVAAIGALGMKTSLQELAKVGWRPLALVLSETGFLLAFVLTCLFLSRYPGG